MTPLRRNEIADRVDELRPSLTAMQAGRLSTIGDLVGTIRDEVTCFTGETRQGLRGSDYLALLMLPFRDEQVREYLTANLDRDAGKHTLTPDHKRLLMEEIAAALWRSGQNA